MEQFCTPPEQHFTEAAFQISNFSFLSEGSRRDGGVFKAAQISPFYDIPAWEFLKVRDLRFSLIFKAKPTRNGCLPDCPHTPTAGLEKIFSMMKESPHVSEILLP